MMNVFRNSLAIAAVAGLSACGGSSSSDEPFVATASQFQGTLSEIGLTSATEIEGNLSLEATTVDQMPPTGSAEYNGQIALFVGEDATNALTDESDASLETIEGLLLGEVDIDVDFTSTGGSYEGTATDFIDAANARYTGTLVMSDGRLERVEPPEGEEEDGVATALLSSITGTLTAPDSIETEFDGNVVGSFAGPDANVVGLVGGDAVQSGEDTTFFGAFVATD